MINEKENKGTKDIKDIEPKEEMFHVKQNEMKKQKVSKSYALKALMSHVVTLVREGLMSQEDGEAIQDMWKKAAEKYTMELMGKMKVK